MKRRAVPWGCALAGLIVLVLVVAGGAWWFLRLRYTMGKAPPSPAVEVFLISPSSGDDVSAGDYVAVAMKAIALGGIRSSELFVDGQAQKAVSEAPESASWTWRAWPAGIHTLQARATSADGKTGESQTVIVNVMKASDALQVLAGEGQTLADVGEEFGVPADQMTAANPHADPTKPLLDGQPVHVPTGGAAPEPPGGAGNAEGGGFPLTILWELKLTKPADKSYCYVSSGDGIWEKMPKPPFGFFQSLDNLYTQIFEALPQKEITVQAQCWGWVGNALQFLGQGQTTFDAGQEPSHVELDADAFQLIGALHFGSNSAQADVASSKVPPPYGLRKPANGADCQGHGGGSLVCETALNAPVSSSIVLEWEWIPGVDSGNTIWLNDIQGYRLYAIDAMTQSPKYLGKVDGAAAKATTLPLIWGGTCYGVTAYVDGAQYNGMIQSTMSTYCPSEPAPTKELKLAPSDWLTGGGEWITQDCPFELPHNEFGAEPIVEVGSYMTFYDGGCFQQGQFAGAVKFPVDSLPAGAVVQNAVLSFSTQILDYLAAGKTLGVAPQNCVAEVGTAEQDWSGLNSGTHFSSTSPASGAYYTPFTSISAWMKPAVDVTPVVLKWAQHPENNHGFVLTPMDTPEPDEGYGACLSALGNFSLDIHYFAP